MKKKIGFLIVLICLPLNLSACAEPASSGDKTYTDVIAKYYDLAYDIYLSMEMQDMSDVLDMSSIQNQNFVDALEANTIYWDYSIQKGYTIDTRERYPLHYDFAKIEKNDGTVSVTVDISGDDSQAYPPFVVFGENNFILKQIEDTWLITQHDYNDIHLFEISKTEKYDFELDKVRMRVDEEHANTDLSDVATSYGLTTGYYTVGTDLPEGTCDINWIDGSGSFGCYDNMSKSIDINKQNKTYLGLELEKGDILMIWDTLKINVTYSTINGGYTGSAELAKDSIILGAGNYKTGQYEVGKDLKAGTYNIYGEFDWGNVTCGDIGLDSTITAEPANYETGQVHVIKNVDLINGSILRVIGCKVKLVPVKANK